MESDPRERAVVAQLRVVMTVLVVLGLIAVVVANQDYLRLFISASFLPVGWVYWRPRWGQIVFWAMWLMAPAMLVPIVESNTPWRLATPSHFLMLGVLAGVWVVLPMLRRGHKPPLLPRSSNLPKARVVR